MLAILDVSGLTLGFWRMRCTETFQPGNFWCFVRTPGIFGLHQDKKLRARESYGGGGGIRSENNKIEQRNLWTPPLPLEEACLKLSGHES